MISRPLNARSGGSKYAAGIAPDSGGKAERDESRSTPREVRIISHSNIFYWWPAWVAGYAVALITSMQGSPIAFEPGVS